MKNKNFKIANEEIYPGEKKTIGLPAACLYTQTPIMIPVHVLNGKKKGPILFIIAAIHGDEINGVEIIRRLLTHPVLKKIRGTLIAVPVANVFGFVGLSRYLQDRRDLNRSFPGTKRGSLGARIANMLMQEIISKCTHVIDLHTGNVRSDNLPHVRTSISVPGAFELAKAFNVPIIIDAKTRDGSIRQACASLKIPTIVYEGGEALRFNEFPIRIGLRGILNVLTFLKMIPHKRISKIKKIKPKLANYSLWSRAPESGILYPLNALGTEVEKGEKLGVIADPFSQKETEIIAPLGGVVIGKTTLPLVNKGDAIFHIVQIQKKEEVVGFLKDLRKNLISDPFSYK